MSRIERWFPGTSVGDWTGGQFGGGASGPGAPGTLSLVSPAASDNSGIDLTWAHGISGSEAVSGFHIQISTDGSSWSDKVADTGSSAVTYTATGLAENTQYWFRVAAINSVGEGDYGNETSATTPTVFAYSTTGSPTTRTYTVGATSYKSLHWTSTGTFVLTANLDSVKFDMWVVSGGGGGGNGQYSGGYWGGAGGGGAGGAQAFTNQTLSTATHTMTVGAGGGGGVAGGYPPNGVAGTGSSAGGMGTSGGGYGGLYNYVGGNGGSGGGGGGWQGPIGGTGASGQGNNGGQGGQETQSPMNGGGGGGKGGVGQGHASSPTISYTVNGGAGGTGGTNDYADGTTSGVGVGQWAGGGGGGSQVGGAATHGGGAGGSSATGSAGTANSGGGGGGTGTDTVGGTGGSGAVIIRWVT
jgi:hypothetical protein